MSATKLSSSVSSHLRKTQVFDSSSEICVEGRYDDLFHIDKSCPSRCRVSAHVGEDCVITAKQALIVTGSSDEGFLDAVCP